MNDVFSWICRVPEMSLTSTHSINVSLSYCLSFTPHDHPGGRWNHVRFDNQETEAQRD